MSHKLSNDPSLTSLPLLTTFLKYFSRPFMGITPPTAKQIPSTSEPGTLATSFEEPTHGQQGNEDLELVEKEIRDRFKRMCEGYFDSVSKKLLVEHNVGCLSHSSPFKSHLFPHSVFKSKTGAIMKLIYDQEKSLRTVSKRTRR